MTYLWLRRLPCSGLIAQDRPQRSLHVIEAFPTHPLHVHVQFRTKQMRVLNSTAEHIPTSTLPWFRFLSWTFPAIFLGFRWLSFFVCLRLFVSINIARNNNKQLRKTKGNHKTEKTEAFLFFISCSVMTRHHEVGFRHNLQDFAAISLPDLSEPSRTSKNFRETINS